MNLRAAEASTPSAWRAAWWLAALPAIALLLVAAALALHAQPQTDDFCTFGRLVQSSGGNPFAETWYLYTAWSGRYASSLLIAMGGSAMVLMPGHAEGWSYGAVLVVGIGAAIVSMQRAVSSEGATAAASWAVAALAIAAVIALMGSPLEGVFWLTGAAVYSAGLIAVLLLASMVQRSLDEAQGRWWLSPWTALLILFACGFNELLTASLGLWLGLLVLVRWNNDRWRTGLLILIVALAGAAATALAPGNFVRDALSTLPRHDLGLAWTMASDALDLFWTHQVADERSIWGWLAAGAFAAGIAARHRKEPRPWRESAPLLLALLSAVPLHALLYPFLVGEAMPGRVVNQAYAMGIVGLALLSFRCGLSVGGLMPDGLRGSTLRLVALAAVLATSLAVWSAPGVERLSLALGGPAGAWSGEHAERRALIAAAIAEGRRDVVVPAIPTRPELHSLVSGADLTGDAGHWINLCVAHYHGLQSVKTDPIDE